jgi:hypothetical protein
MTDEQKAWAQVYATILSGLLSNNKIEMNWERLRERAECEANLAWMKASGV